MSFYMCIYYHREKVTIKSMNLGRISCNTITDYFYIEKYKLKEAFLRLGYKKEFVCKYSDDERDYTFYINHPRNLAVDKNYFLMNSTQTIAIFDILSFIPGSLVPFYVRAAYEKTEVTDYSKPYVIPILSKKPDKTNFLLTWNDKIPDYLDIKFDDILNLNGGNFSNFIVRIKYRDNKMEPLKILSYILPKNPENFTFPHSLIESDIEYEISISVVTECEYFLNYVQDTSSLCGESPTYNFNLSKRESKDK